MSTSGHNKEVLILGGGLSAAYISAACHDVGATFDVKTMQKSPKIFGAIWLRWLPERIASKHRKYLIHVIPIGTEYIYLKKQWGKTDFTSSFPEDVYEVEGYNPNLVLKDLWATDAYHIVASGITDKMIENMADKYGVIFMTFPTEECKKDSTNYQFNTPCAVWDLDENNVDQRPRVPIGNRVFYMGNDSDVVRHSQLFGKIYVEYVHKHIPNVDAMGDKGKIYWFTDLHPNTPVWDEERVPAGNVYLVGRYAQRDRKVLAHEAYQRAVDIMEKNL